jgi:alanine racemase
MYGYGPKWELGRTVQTRPFLQWKTRLVQVKKVPSDFPVSYESTYVTSRETHIGTLDVGYSDGYSRLLSNKGWVIVNGERRPVAGRVTMNLTAVDLGPVTVAKEGDEVVLLGAQGNEAIWADEMAGWRGTISYEVLTNIRTDDRRVKPA